MIVSVWDTYVKRSDGRIMHFDILVPDHVTDEKTVFEYGKDYLKKKSISNTNISTKECRFCHVEGATPSMITQIEQNGYDIIEMENCD